MGADAAESRLHKGPRRGAAGRAGHRTPCDVSGEWNALRGSGRTRRRCAAGQEGGAGSHRAPRAGGLGLVLRVPGALREGCERAGPDETAERPRADAKIGPAWGGILFRGNGT